MSRPVSASRIAIIANPHAGRGRAIQAAQEARRKLWGWDLDFRFPGSIQELQSIADGLDASYRAVIVIGGDGTLNQVLRGRLLPEVALLPYPNGTANDLAMELGLTADWEHVQRLLDQGATERIDLLQVNGVPFATVAGTGIGAKLTHEYNQKRQDSALFKLASRKLQAQSYLFLSAKTILLGRDYFQKIHVRSDAFEDRLKAAALFVCNQATLGGKLRVAPEIANNDRRFNVLIVPRTQTWDLIHGLADLRNGRIPPDLIAFSTNRLKVTQVAGKNIRVFGDGEILTEAPELDFRLRDNPIQVFSDRRRSLATLGRTLSEWHFRKERS